MGPLLSIAIGMLPELLKLFAGDKENSLSEKVREKVIGIAKSDDPKVVEKNLEDPVKRAELQKELAELAFEATKEQNRAAAEARQAELEAMKEEFAEAERIRQSEMLEFRAEMESTRAAQTQWADMANSGNALAWINPVLSIIITFGFLYVLYRLMGGSAIAEGNKDIFNVALGALATAFATVIGFHFGSSFGSKRKSDMIEAEQNTRLGKPGPVTQDPAPRPTPHRPQVPEQRPDAPRPTPTPTPPGPHGLFLQKAPVVMRRLIDDFNLTPVQAAGILGNIGAECGGFKLLQELRPTVAGSRGGWGWCQWTGPRRRQFEAWASEQNLDFSSDEANYGFLRFELTETSEKAVLPRLREADTITEATEVFMRKFLRPGIPHLGSRINWADRALKAFSGG
jgi:hypothetical protein